MQKPVQKNSESWKPRLDLGSLASVIFFGFLIVAFGVMEPDVFLSADNFASILNNGAVLAILACGLTIVLAVGEFDLSIAASASFAGALSAVMVSQFGLGLTTVIPAVIVTGIVIGIVNGILVTRYEMPALIATIGVSSLLDGLTLWITGNSVIFSGLDDNFLFIGDWRIALLQAPVFYLAVVATVLFVAMRYTTVGRHIYAAGGNRAASRMSGIRVDRQVITAFVVAGVLGSIAGLIYTARQGSLTPLFGTSMLLPTFAAAFLGSVTLARRRFHILGTVIGVYLIETGTTGLLILGAPAYTQQLFAGGVLILATIGARHRAR
ncbi:ABC transporter permease [Mesorhizobium sp. M7A.F.Ca.US.006.01.1.1]|uniref:ABC transporter permease n=1 Tax=Mesorhizobium sp. M7A.F.Ca.US.006.01.1.1 TaxID=2496707 RepID=UPI0013E32222|nr:ABC transporter permease [Mesorhizobium sp. M7A.F.Ca.US.006.01.1.1]